MSDDNVMRNAAGIVMFRRDSAEGTFIGEPDIERLWVESLRHNYVYRPSRWTAERVARALVRLSRMEARIAPDDVMEDWWTRFAAVGLRAAWPVPKHADKYPVLKGANWMALEGEHGTMETADGPQRSFRYGEWYGPRLVRAEDDRYGGKGEVAFEGDDHPSIIARRAKDSWAKPLPSPSDEQWQLGYEWAQRDWRYMQIGEARAIFTAMYDFLVKPTGVPPKTGTSRRVETPSSDGTGIVVSWWSVRERQSWHHLPVDERREWHRFMPLEVV